MAMSIRLQRAPEWVKTKGKQVKRSFKDLFAQKLVARSDNPYATHIPILTGISKLYPIKHVLEIGSGENSTLTFLNRSAFPALASLTSLENDIEWKEKVEKVIAGDPRPKIHYIEGPMHEGIRSWDLKPYDLIFIDDSVSADLRAATIVEVAKRLGESQFLIIHDYECKEYQKAVTRMKFQFRFDSLNPNTGLVATRPVFDKIKLRKLNCIIKNHCNVVHLNDIDRWSDLFDVEL